MAARHVAGKVALIFLTVLLLLGTIFVGMASGVIREYLPVGWFLTDLDVGEDFVRISPSAWVFYLIWTIIYIAQICFMGYALGLVCRKANDNQGYLYHHPGHMPYLVFIFYNLANVFNVLWVFFNDRSYSEASAAVLWGSPIMLYVAIGLSYSAYYKHGQAIMRMGHKHEIAVVRTFVHNSLAVYATWTTLAANLQTTKVIVYTGKIDDNIVGLAVHGALAGQVILFYALDWTILDRFSRYTFTPYFVLIIAFAGITDRNLLKHGKDPNSVFSAVLLAVTIVGLIAKIIIVAQKARTEKEPLLNKKTWA